MKAICMLYQTPTQTIMEKVDKDGEKMKSVEIEERVLTKELAKEFPEFQKNGVQLGAKVKVPKVAKRENLIVKNGFTMEIEFVFPDGHSGEAERVTKEMDSFTKEWKDNEDHQKTLLAHIQFLVNRGWELSTMTGSRYGFTKPIQ